MVLCLLLSLHLTLLCAQYADNAALGAAGVGQALSFDNRVRGTAWLIDRGVRNMEAPATQLIQDLARTNGGQMQGLDFRFKGQQGIQGKLVRNKVGWGESLGRQQRIFDDALRYTVELPTAQYSTGVNDAVRQLEAKGYKFTKLKNTWTSPDYKGINAVVEGPAQKTWWGGQKAGSRFELQFHTPESFAAKQGEMHHIYEQLRAVDGPKKGTAAYDKLIERSREISAAIPKPAGVDDIASKLATAPQSKLAAAMEAARFKGIQLAAKDAALIASKGWTGAGFGAASRQIGRNIAAGASKAGSLLGKAAAPLAVLQAGHSVAMSVKDANDWKDDLNKGRWNGKAYRDAILGVTTDLVLGKGGTVALAEGIGKGAKYCGQVGARCVLDGIKGVGKGVSNLYGSANQATKQCFGDFRQCATNMGNGLKKLGNRATQGLQNTGDYIQGRWQKWTDRRDLCRSDKGECKREKLEEKANRKQAWAAGRAELKNTVQTALADAKQRKEEKKSGRFLYGGERKGNQGR